MESRLKAEGFKSRVINVIRAWEEWTIYPKEFLAKIKSVFLGKQIPPSPPPVEEFIEEAHEDIDGAPLSGDEKDDEDLDGIPLDGAALLKSALMRGLPDAMSIQKSTPTRDIGNDDDDDDIDGVPLDEDIDGIPLEKLSSDHNDAQFKANAKGGAFIPSKWEIVDPEQVEAQAITTSKWDTLDPPQAPKFYDSSDDEQSNSNAAQSYDDDKRTKLREIEMKTMQYQDELEAGMRQLKSGWTMSDQVEHFRRKLLKKDNEATDSPLSYMNVKEQRRGSESPDSSSKRARRQKRSPSPAQYQSSTSRSSPTPRSSRKRSHSPYTTRREVSPTPSSTRSNKSSRRNRSRSPSDSPKRYTTERVTYLSKSTRYENSPRPRRSPSPTYSSSRSSKRDDREREYRSEKHKSRHRH